MFREKTGRQKQKSDTHAERGSVRHGRTTRPQKCALPIIRRAPNHRQMTPEPKREAFQRRFLHCPVSRSATLSTLDIVDKASRYVKL